MGVDLNLDLNLGFLSLLEDYRHRIEGGPKHADPCIPFLLYQPQFLQDLHLSGYAAMIHFGLPAQTCDMDLPGLNDRLKNTDPARQTEYLLKIRLLQCKQNELHLVYRGSEGLHTREVGEIKVGCSSSLVLGEGVSSPLL